MSSVPELDKGGKWQKSSHNPVVVGGIYDTHLVGQFGRVHGRIKIGFTKLGISVRVLPSGRDL